MMRRVLTGISTSTAATKVKDRDYSMVPNGATMPYVVQSLVSVTVFVGGRNSMRYDVYSRTPATAGVLAWSVRFAAWLRRLGAALEPLRLGDIEVQRLGHGMLDGRVLNDTNNCIVAASIRISMPKITLQVIPANTMIMPAVGISP